MQAGKLNPDAFPPCIKSTVEGVSSGGRNDAIVLLLTSFASYARLYPRIFASDETVKVSDMDPDFVRSIFMTPCATVQEAYDAAAAELGADASVIVMPYGGSTLPKLK